MLTAPGALCTALIESESDNGIARLHMDPRRALANGAISWTAPKMSGSITVTLTCDKHKTFATTKDTFTVG